ncbi:hypothetical protein MUK42_28644 [Musa troglodytarum]|uniref:Uncharacterized protein n=1 Tax=Musa troglodytarum TaxID=320322 RepID=A0A9E7FWC0_9LILI|nr:hypothetical protein MUK42_28644 [Musa troglodytarum]
MDKTDANKDMRMEEDSKACLGKKEEFDPHGELHVWLSLNLPKMQQFRRKHTESLGFKHSAKFPTEKNLCFLYSLMMPNSTNQQSQDPSQRIY